MPDTSAIIETDIPARLDRLPWTRFHTLVVVALGITWILDGLEVTLAGSIAGALQESPVLHFDAAEVGLVGTAYLTGAVTGAVLFGYLTDRFGRRRLFFVTLGLYFAATAATAFSWRFLEFRAVSFSDRSRHRRRIHGDQLGDTGVHPGALPRPYRSRDQRQLLDRCSARRGGCRAVPAARQVAAGLGMARRLRDRRLARPRHSDAAAVHAGEPALADAARAARRGGGGDRQIERRVSASPGCAVPVPAARPNTPRGDLAHADRADGAGDHSRLSAASHSRARADGCAGVFLQRDLFLLRTRSDAVLRRSPRRRSAGTSCPLRSAIFSDPCCSGRCST